MNDLNNTTNEPEDPAIPTPYLQVNALYIHNVLNIMYIAVNPTEVELLSGAPDAARGPMPDIRLYAQPGSELWVNHMLEFRGKTLRESESIRRQMIQTQDQARHLEESYERLGEALRDKAIEKDWCDEYDEFAEQWDLPKRAREYEVTVTVRVLANTDDHAEELVAENFSMSMYDDIVVDGPHIIATEV